MKNFVVPGEVFDFRSLFPFRLGVAEPVFLKLCRIFQAVDRPTLVILANSLDNFWEWECRVMMLARFLGVVSAIIAMVQLNKQTQGS